MVVVSQKDQNPNFTSDAPPAYEDLVSNQTAATFTTLRQGDEKRRSIGSTTAVSDLGDGVSVDARRASGSYIPSNVGPPLSPAKTTRSIGINKNWFSWFSEKDTRKEVKQTIQSLVGDVVKDPTSPTAACVLQSCLEACQSKGLSFQNIISEKFMEGHSPIYWAIAKRTPRSSDEAVSNSENPVSQTSGSGEDRVELLDILLSMPLNSTTRLEAYSACLLTSDNTLFQRLRSIPDEQVNNTPGGNTSIGADELLLGETPDDKIQVLDGEADYGEFRIIWDITHFQKRMRAIGSVSVQVVVRGHIWHLSFVILQKDIFHNSTSIKAGAWVVCVSLVEPSPSSHLYAQIRISEPPECKQGLQKKGTPDTYEPAKGGNSLSMQKFGRKSMWSNNTKSTQAVRGGTGNGGGSKPSITLSLRTDSTMTDDPLEPVHLSVLKDLPCQFTRRKCLLASLDNHLNGRSLQYDGSSYLNAEGTLQVVFEAGLSKRSSMGNDCIIC